MKINSERFNEHIENLLEQELSDIHITELVSKSWFDDCIDWDKVEFYLEKEIREREISSIEERMIDNYLANKELKELGY